MKYSKSYKKVPKFWWDYAGEYHIQVQSDNPKYPVIKYFCFNGDEDLEFAITSAEELIRDLKHGRKTMFYEEPLEECREFIFK